MEVSDELTNSPADRAEAPAFLSEATFIALDGKTPVKKGWTTDPAARFDADEAYSRVALGGNVGVALGPDDLVIDVDPRNFAEGDDPFERLKAQIGDDLSGFPAVRTGSGGWHVYMRLPERTGRIKRDLAKDGFPGIDLKFVGGQVVAPGSVHPETGKPYVVERDLDPLDEDLGIPVAPDALLALVARPDGVRVTAGPGSKSPEWLAGALSLLLVEDFRDHDRWMQVMMGSHDATGGGGCAEFVAWSVGDPVYEHDADSIARRWDSLDTAKANRVTARTLEWHLEKAGVLHLVEPDYDEVAEDFADIEGLLPAHLNDAPTETTLDRINASQFTVLTGGRYLVGRERFDERLKRHTVDWNPDEAVRKHMNIKAIETAENKKEKLGDWWLRHPQRRQYDWVIFDPAPKEDDPAVYNLWRGWAVEPRKGDWSHLKRLLKDVLCRGDEVSFDYVMRWSAFMVQHPNTPAEVALVFKGRKGTGKGTFCRALKELAGQHGRQVAQPEHFTGRFNEHLTDTILLFVDEGLWAGDKKVEGVLKNLITEPVLSFEGKNKPIIEGPNHLHIVIASNEDWVIPATPDERRFAVFETDEEAFKTLPRGFFDDLREQMDRGGRAAMLHDLLAMELGDWHPRKGIPQTEALVSQKVEGFRSDPLAYWWHRALEDGKIDFVEAEGEWPEAFTVGSQGKGDMLDSLDTSARSTRHRAEFTKTKLARFLNRVGVDVKARDRKGNKVWAIPPLEEARSAFEQHVGGSIDWGD